ncbi:MAG: ABC transporter substrate-binding protein [Solirubrobacterales bacterium]|nr:ABC transporter substrate-binding protein [Solirubrobacterales bacterium]
MRRALPIVLVAAACLIASCGDEDEQPTTRVAGDTLTVYASLPAHGDDAAAGRAAEAGMRAALRDAGGTAAGRTVRLEVLSATRPEDDAWDPGTVEANAERAADDDTTIAYLGELDRGASAISLPVTSRAGILQVSPADGLASYTRRPPGRPRAGPERYYPGERRNLVRMVPSDLGSAREIVAALRSSGARRLAVIHGNGIADRELEAMVLWLLGDGPPKDVFRADALPKEELEPAEGEVERTPSGEPEPLADLVAELAAARPDVLLYSGPADAAGIATLRAVARELPDLPVIGGPPLARAAGLPGMPSTGCAMTGVPPAAELPPRGRRLLERLRASGGDPDLGGEAVLGYEAMRRALAAVEEGGPDRAAVVAAARPARVDDGPVGPYAIDRRGDREDAEPVCVGLADAVAAGSVLAGRLP